MIESLAIVVSVLLTIATPAESLQLVWSAGVEDDELLFGVVLDVACHDGRTYVLDWQRDSIAVLGDQGELIADFGRKGEAPGECSGRKHNLSIDARTEQLVIPQVFPNRIVRMDLATGSPLDDLPIPDFANAGRSLLLQVARDGDGLVAAYMRYDFEGRVQHQTRRVSHFAADGNETVLAERETYINFGGTEFRETDFQDVTSRWAAAADGTIALVPQLDEYEIELWKHGRRVATIRRPEYQALARSESERSYVRALVGMGLPENAQVDVLEHHPSVRSLWWRGEELWVLDARGRFASGDPSEVSFQCFTNEGKALGERRLRVDGSFEFEDRIVLCDRHLHRIRNEASSKLTVDPEASGAGWADQSDEPVRLETWGEN